MPSFYHHLDNIAIRFLCRTDILEVKDVNDRIAVGDIKSGRQPDNYYTLDKCFRSLLRKDKIIPEGTWHSIAFRTFALGEFTRRASNGRLSRNKFIEIHRSDHLLLEYSRFMELAPDSIVSPGPRPIETQAMRRDRLFKFGIHLRAHEEKEILDRIISEAPKALRAFNVLKNRADVILGFSLLNDFPMRLRWSVYFIRDNRDRNSEKSLANELLTELRTNSDTIQDAESFLRSGNSSQFYPDHSCSRVFTQKGLADVPYTFLAGELQCA